MGPHRCAQPSARAPQPCGLSKEKRDVERGRVPGKGVEKPSPATPVLKYWKKPHAGEMPVVLPGHLHPTAGRRTQLWWTQPASTPKSSFPESLVIPSVRGGERGKRNRGTDKIILSLLQHCIKAKQALFREMSSGAYFVRRQHLEFKPKGAES